MNGAQLLIRTASDTWMSGHLSEAIGSILSSPPEKVKMEIAVLQREESANEFLDPCPHPYQSAAM